MSTIPVTKLRLKFLLLTENEKGVKLAVEEDAPDQKTNMERKVVLKNETSEGSWYEETWKKSRSFPLTRED